MCIGEADYCSSDINCTIWLEIKQHIMSCCSIPCFTVVIRKETVGDMRFKDILKEDYVFWLTL